MENALEIPSAPPAALLDGALALALCSGAPLRLQGPLQGADLAVALAAVRLSGDAAAVEAARVQLGGAGPSELRLTLPRPGVHALALAEPGAVARAAVALAWPLALLGRLSTLHLIGPNHCAAAATFHDLRLGWAPQAASFGLRSQLELRLATFAGTEGAAEGELVLTLDPSPALTPLHLSQRGLLCSVTVVAACSGGPGPAGDESLQAARAAARRLRAFGVSAEVERVPLPLPPSSSAAARAGWAITAVAEFERSVVSLSSLGPFPAPGPARLPGAPEAEAAAVTGLHLADRLGRFLESRGALDGAAAERLLLPAILCAAGLGARAGPPPSCHFTTTEVTEGLLALASLAHTVFPVRAVIDGAPGEEGVVAVAPSARDQ